MSRRNPSGCLYAVIFFIALAASAVLIVYMLSSVKSTDGSNLFEQITERLGIDTGKADDSSSSGSGTGRGDSAETPDSPDANSDPAPAEGELADLPSTDAIRIEITQEKMRELMEDAMKDTFPLTLSQVEISSNGTITLTGSAERDKFIELLDGQDSALGTLERMTLGLAPEELNFSVKAAVSYDAADGEVSFEPESLSVADISIPVSLLPGALKEKAGSALTDFFASYGRTPAGLTLYDGYMRIYFE